MIARARKDKSLFHGSRSPGTHHRRTARKDTEWLFRIAAVAYLRKKSCILLCKKNKLYCK